MSKELIETIDGYKYKINSIREHCHSTLNGRLKRLLKTALDATNADQPYIECIKEKIEDSLKIIENEIEYLNSTKH